MQIQRKVLALTAMTAFVFAACSGGTASQEPTESASASASAAASSEAPAEKYKACVAFDTGGLGDKGFNDLALKGLQEAEAKGYEIAYSESKGSSDYAANIQTLIDQGCQSIITVGFNQGQATVEATKNNPDIAFAQVDTTWDETNNGPIPANFTGIDFQVDEAGMLAGYLAAGFSKTGKIGTYGGMQFPGVTRFMDGLYAGVKYHNEQKGTTAEVLGWNAATQTGTFVGGDNPWGDAAKGEQLAKTFVDQGADIVHPVAGSTGNGSIKYMLSKGLYAIGVDNDQAVTLADYAKAIITSSQKVIDAAVLATIEKNAGGDMGGENYVGTLANGGVALSPYHEFDSQISADLKAEIEALKAKIVSGEVKVADYMK